MDPFIATCVRCGGNWSKAQIEAAHVNAMLSHGKGMGKNPFEWSAQGYSFMRCPSCPTMDAALAIALRKIIADIDDALINVDLWSDQRRRLRSRLRIIAADLTFQLTARDALDPTPDDDREDD